MPCCQGIYTEVWNQLRENLCPSCLPHICSDLTWYCWYLQVIFLKWMSKIPSSMVILLRESICSLLLGILVVLTKFVNFVVLVMVTNKLHELGLQSSVLLLQALVLCDARTNNYFLCVVCKECWNYVFKLVIKFFLNHRVNTFIYMNLLKYIWSYLKVKLSLTKMLGTYKTTLAFIIFLFFPSFYLFLS